MIRSTLFAAIAAATLATPAAAGIYTDDLSKCLVAKTTEADRQTFMQYMFAMMSAHPSVQAMAKVTPAQRAQFDRSVGAVINRLMVTDCRTETVAALKYEGTASLQGGFEVFGRVAMVGLLSDPAVAAQLNGLTSAIDSEKLRALGREAGVAMQAPAPAK